MTAPARLVKDMIATDYHAADGVSSSRFREFLRSPQHFVAYDPSETEAMHFGSRLHEHVLEGKDPAFTFLKTPKSNEERVRLIEAMGKAIRTHSVASEILRAKGSPEASAFVEDADTGLLIKARFDLLLDDGIVVDLKTTSASAKPEDFERAIFNYGYHIQAAWYCRVLSRLIGKPCNQFVFIAIEKKAPYGISVLRLKDDALRFGAGIISANLPRLVECKAKNEWPGYPEEVREVGLPAWVMNRAPVFEEVA